MNKLYCGEIDPFLLLNPKLDLKAIHNTLNLPRAILKTKIIFKNTTQKLTKKTYFWMVHFFFMQNFLNAKKLKNIPLVNSLGTKRSFYAYCIPK